MRGGLRKGAGRKKGVGNLLTQELKAEINGPKLIKFLRDLAYGKIEGSAVCERKDAATTLFKKILPDISKNEFEAQEFNPIQIVMSKNVTTYKDKTN